MRFLPLVCTLGSAWALLSTAPLRAENASPVFRAGAVTVDITPQKFPRIIAGSFLENRASKVTDPLHVRCFVLDDGKLKIAFAIVDTCMMPQSLIDEAKGIASKECGIPVDRMMVSATHTHSAPAAMGCLGTRLDKEYADTLTQKIAEGIVAASKKLEPAKIGWASVDDWEHTHNRRWIRLPGKEVVDPYGQPTGRANMHPGYLSKDVVGPSGPVDPQLSVIAIQTLDGKPLGVLANYSQHYFGATAVSADYYGLFCKHLATKMGQQGDGNGPFVCAMSQGTSGDLMWMDYGAEKKNLTLDTYAAAVADSAMKALESVKYHKHVPLGMVEKTLELAYRVPDEKRLEWARPIASKIQNDLPKDKPEVYAREALILHERQKTTVKLQAIRIGEPENGEIGITTLPNEVYALTGLQLKWSSPFHDHFNIELANGAEGYIPPREQHELGGYTTWPARTAGLEVGAEEKIRKTLNGMMMDLDLVPGRGMSEDSPPYSTAIYESHTRFFIDFQDGLLDLRAASDDLFATPGPTPTWSVKGGHALYLPGFNAGRGYGDESALKPQEVWVPRDKINRSIHLAGGHIEASHLNLGPSASIALWFWLGHESGASDRECELVNALGVSLKAKQDARHRVRLTLGGEESKEELLADDWHFAVLIRDGENVRVHIDGAEKPSLEGKAGPAAEEVFFGRSLEGRLDEIAIWKRAIEPSLIAKLWNISKVGETNARHLTQRKDRESRKPEASKVVPSQLPVFPADYAKLIASLKPRTDVMPEGTPISAGSALSRLNPSPGLPSFKTPLGARWSAALWFSNEMPNDARPVTAYLFSRGPSGNSKAPGDHLGIGGHYKDNYTGKLIVFNGNEANQVLSGTTVIQPGTWNHAVLVRDGSRVRVWLNGADKPEIDEELPVTASGNDTLFCAKRCDGFAPLQGGIAQIAVFDRSLSAAEAKQLHTAAGQPAPKLQTTSPAPSSRAKLELSSPPLSPEESMKKWHVREGYKIELVAAEPLVLDPVAFDWDEKGRLWVVEMADYPLGMDGKGKSGGRVVMLEDTNDDAKYDKRTLVADGLNFPTGILTWRDGAIVTAAPDVLFINPGGEKKVLLTGFSTGNQQLRVNGLRWGMDGWVYCAAGAHNAGYNKGTEITSVLTGEKITLGSRDFRFKPDTGAFDPQSGPSQFGRARDDWGHWFGVQNSFPLWHYVLQDHYLRRNPHVISPDPIHQLFTRNPQVYPVSSMEKRFHSFGESGRFTSACGIDVYRDRVLFDDGKTHAFTCEPFHNVVQHHVLEDDGVSFKATRNPAEKRDFLASEDRWCRPVMVRTGPDGALWVADMYRYMIEHPQWLPQNGKDELLPHYREGDDKGRIWRVVREGGRKAHASVRDSVAALQKADKSVRAPFESRNGWVRDKVQMMVAWIPRKEVEAELRWVMKEGAGHSNVKSQVPQSAAQAAWALQQLGLLKAEDVITLLQSNPTGLREQALILAEMHGTPEVLMEAFCHARSTDEKELLQLACTLGAWKSEKAATTLAMILKNHASNASIRGAAMSSALPHLTHLATILAESMEAAHDGMVADLFRCALSAKNDQAIAAILTHTKTRPRLAGLLEVLSARGLSLRAFSASMKSSTFHREIQYAQEVLWQDLVMTSVAMVMRDGANASLEDLQLMAADLERRGEFIKLLPELWKVANAERAKSLLALIVRLQPKDGPDFLLDGWAERTPALRSQIIEALLSNDGWTLAVLERVKSKAVEANACDAATRARLLKHPNAKVKELAGTVFADSGSAAHAAVLEKFKPALQLKGDAANGKTVFAQVCISCHKLDGVGLELGPDLRSVAQHDGEKLLNSILDPSAIIEPGFMAYHCALKNGEQLYGVIATETSTSLTLKLPGNVTRSVLRSDIASLKSTSMSLMPDGLEAVMTPQSLADLIAYLKMARQ